jgi:hypothetical protein
VREPTIEADGWSLENGEEYHRRAPETFWIPDRQARESLHPGDLAKLIFKIALDDPDDPFAYERMWVIVREKTDGGYFGMLDNEPDSIAQNDEFWLGTELPFRPEHIINLELPSEETVDLARRPPRRAWPRD